MPPNPEGTWHIDRIRSNIASLQKEALSQGRKFGFAHHDGDAGGFYEGEFRFFLKHGTGFLQIEPGTDTYQGQFVDDRYEGTGARQWADGSKYTGDWWKGQKHGAGTLVTAPRRDKPGTELTYTGEFKNGLRHGQGEQQYPNGAVYSGQFVDGQLHGKGEYTHADGKVFDGYWKMNKRHGQGVMYDPAKDRTSCMLEQYENGTLVLGTRLERQPAKVYKWRSVNQRATLDAGPDGGVVMQEENTVGVPTFKQRDENRRLRAFKSTGDDSKPAAREEQDAVPELPNIATNDSPRRKEWSPARSSKDWTATLRYSKAGVTKVEKREDGARQSLKLGLG